MDSIINASRATLHKRARAKFSQQKLLRSLHKLDSKLQKKYQDALYCSSVLEQQGNKLRSRFCNQRFCKICNRIRTAKLIKGYGIEIDRMLDPRFVTLTVPNVPEQELRSEIRRMISEFKKIQDLRRKLKQPLIRGIRKLEVTYNPDLQNFHPHFHFIVDGEETADQLIDSWLMRNQKADRRGQDQREAKNPQELFKYFAKLTSKSKSDTIIIKKGKMIRIEYSYPEALDKIFQAMEGTRVIQPVGGIKYIKGAEEVEELETIEIEDIEVEDAIWMYIDRDWVNMNTGELLTGYEPSKRDLSKSKKIRYLHDIESG
jgi:plasmid rolling circle replication initiator protein Rep